MSGQSPSSCEGVALLEWRHPLASPQRCWISAFRNDVESMAVWLLASGEMHPSASLHKHSDRGEPVDVAGGV